MAVNNPNKKKSALGRGLGALLQDSPKKVNHDVEDVRPQAGIFEISLEEIQVNPYQPRSYFRSEEHTSELQSRPHLVCRLLLEKKKKKKTKIMCNNIM